ncbi:MAG: hypothetical protein LC772_06700 [Chloroflexi bacterium]|nr:hypothetical protein [Chloroflexota bacterium]
MTAAQAWIIGLAWFAGYESWALATHHETLSEGVWGCETSSPIVPFGMGFLMGHFVFNTIKNGRPS